MKTNFMQISLIASTALLGFGTTLLGQAPLSGCGGQTHCHFQAIGSATLAKSGSHLHLKIEDGFSRVSIKLPDSLMTESCLKLALVAMSEPQAFQFITENTSMTGDPNNATVTASACQLKKIP